jgi:hypothetical protein
MIIVIIIVATIHMIIGSIAVLVLRAARIMMRLSFEHVFHTWHTHRRAQQLVRVRFGLTR